MYLPMDDANNPLDGRSPNTTGLGADFNTLMGNLFDNVWGLALVVTILVWIVAAAYFGVKQRSNPGQSGGAKTWLYGASAALILVAGASIFIGGLLNVSKV